jgi:chaperonin cofactor prefoldin
LAESHRYSLRRTRSFVRTKYSCCYCCRLVLETLEPLPEDRKCFRMINGVLVERTVKDVIPALKTNSEGLKQVLDDLVLQYKSKQEEMEKWKVHEHP